MTQTFCLLRARRGLIIALATLGFVLFARPAFAQDRSQRTVAYWKQLRAICDEENPGENATVQQKIAAARTVARRIDALSARGVDEEALVVGEKMTRLLRRLADWLDDYGDEKKAFASGFRDGLNNNPTRCIDELKAITSQGEDWEQGMTRARKRLESRNDVDLPSLK